jgi:cytochrome b561/polyisoprenoid-binding protein YceI
MIAPVALSNPSVSHYHSALIFLHWLMAVGITMMLISGAVMVYVELEKQWQFQLYQWHKSGGVLLMLALAMRIVIRIATAIPSLPIRFSTIERVVAKLGHFGLYIAMATMVISGWVMVSSSAYGLPTIVFGWFEWPHIPRLQANQIVERLSKDTHLFGAIGLGLLLIGHIGAVIKHRVVDQENLLTRVWWGYRLTLRAAALSLLVILTVMSAIILMTLARKLAFFSVLKSPIAEITVPNIDPITAANDKTITYSHDFIVDTAHSRVTFSGTHMGTRFTGVFKEWESQFHFDPEVLDQSHIRAVFTISSATTGDSMYDGTLLQSDWLASATYPQATFTSDTIVANRDVSSGNSYRVIGLLTLRNISKPISFDMHIRDLNTASMQLNASFTIDRLAYRIGASSDPEADWVSREIAVQLEIHADRH